jgi:hypothetical protein
MCSLGGLSMADKVLVDHLHDTLSELDTDFVFEFSGGFLVLSIFSGIGDDILNDLVFEFPAVFDIGELADYTSDPVEIQVLLEDLEVGHQLRVDGLRFVFLGFWGGRVCHLCKLHIFLFQNDAGLSVKVEVVVGPNDKSLNHVVFKLRLSEQLGHRGVDFTLYVEHLVECPS